MLKNCSLPFAPQVCFNEAETTYSFPDPKSSVYAIMCSFPSLSTKNQNSHQFLVAAKSLLSTRPKHGLIICQKGLDKCSNTTCIEGTYQRTLESWNVKPFVLQELFVPEEGYRFHDSNGQHACAMTYQKLVAWSLVQYKKMAIIDMDIVLLDIIDHIFSLPTSAIGSDCSPHDNTDDAERTWVSFQSYHCITYHWCNYR